MLKEIAKGVLFAIGSFGTTYLLTVMANVWSILRLDVLWQVIVTFTGGILGLGVALALQAARNSRVVSDQRHRVQELMLALEGRPRDWSVVQSMETTLTESRPQEILRRTVHASNPLRFTIEASGEDTFDADISLSFFGFSTDMDADRGHVIEDRKENISRWVVRFTPAEGSRYYFRIRLPEGRKTSAVKAELSVLLPTKA